MSGIECAAKVDPPITSSLPVTELAIDLGYMMQYVSVQAIALQAISGRGSTRRYLHMPRIAEYGETRTRRVYHLALDAHNLEVARCMCERACDYYLTAMKQLNVAERDTDFRQAEAKFWEWWVHLFEVSVREARDA